MLESINTFWNQILYALLNIRFFDLIDILAVAFIIYQAIRFFRDSRAGQLIKGIVIILIIFIFANWFNLVTIKWLLTKLADSIIVVAAIVFQPELRRALEKMGRSGIGKIGRPQVSNYDIIEDSIGSVCKAASNMSDKKIGALIVFERKTPLGEIAATGTDVDATVSTELVQNIFYPKSPLHDGGMIIRSGRILSAGCILPLTSNTNLNSQLGTRHRAAIGMSETSDAVILVVSEETGNISLACNGALTSNYNPISLREDLEKYLLTSETRENLTFSERVKKFFGRKKSTDKNDTTENGENE